ncbi:MAG TPA: hypothetical protein VFO93_05490 [Hymenobacter sp.]|uniref:hypothetical protein n=1 Tax=Hymenobacter sp. TaxID=1898978 RepID=UPI002D7E7CB4|nr:hypothetical protein [Hymenobacter sp.]HET9502970.1 hypothetical protein [Hymenobacter sp.]
MAYTDFTPAGLTQQFDLDFQAARLFSGYLPQAPSAWLVETLQRAQRIGYVSEKARSERLVSPVLTELNELSQQQFTFHSGVNLDVDAAAGLRGECDFVLSLSPIRDFIVAPIFCITEAKKQDLEAGTVQCAAQLVGAQRLNELAHRPVPVLYGCSTTGVDWRFLTLVGQRLTLDHDVYSIRELPILLGVMQHIVHQAANAVA